MMTNKIDWNSMLSPDERFDLAHFQKMKPKHPKNWDAELYLRTYRPERYYRAILTKEQRLEFEAIRRNNPNITYAEYYRTYLQGGQ
jgi:hypothetical protein